MTARSVPRPHPASPKLCVFTALLGGYEFLNEQPVARESAVPFICFTDDPELHSDTWQIRQVTPLFEMDPVRSQRDFKLRPHVHLPEYDWSLYIDNAVVLTKTPEQIFERYVPASGFCLPKSSFHATVLDEFMKVLKLGYDDQSRVFEQLNHYTLVCPEVLEDHPYQGGLMLRDHRDPKVQAMHDLWFTQVLRYSRRDQLSINVAFRQTGLVPDLMDIESIYASWCHTWPHLRGRDRDKSRVSPVVSVTPLAARVRQLESLLAEAEERRDQVLCSDAWRIGRRLEEGAKKHPRLVRPVIRVLRRVLRRPPSS